MKNLHELVVERCRLAAHLSVRLGVPAKQGRDEGRHLVGSRGCGFSDRGRDGGVGGVKLRTDTKQVCGGLSQRSGRCNDEHPKPPHNSRVHSAHRMSPLQLVRKGPKYPICKAWRLIEPGADSRPRRVGISAQLACPASPIQLPAASTADDVGARSCRGSDPGGIARSAAR